MQSVLVTGGAGFIGSHLVNYLLNNSYKVCVLDDCSTGKLRRVPSGINFYNRSVLSELSDVFENEKPSVIFHLAAQTSLSKSFSDILLDTDINIKGTVNILEHCKKFNVKKIVFSSTAAVYGDLNQFPLAEDQVAPASPYGIAKLSAENYINLYAKKYGIDASILRLANVFGPDQTCDGEAGVIAVFISRLLKKQPICIHGNGEQTRDFVYVKDVVNAMCQAINTQGVFNISTNTELSINELFNSIKVLIKTDLVPQHDFNAYFGSYESRLSYQKAREAFNYTPQYEFSKALDETVSWFQGNLNLL